MEIIYFALFIFFAICLLQIIGSILYTKSNKKSKEFNHSKSTSRYNEMMDKINKFDDWAG